MTVVYQLYEAVQTFASDEEEAIINDEKLTQIKIEEEKKAIEEQKRIEEEKLLESKTFTPVTKELFDEWYKNFLKKVRGGKTKTENDGRLTGREFFMNKNIKIEDNEEEIEREKEDGNKIQEVKEEEFNPELYEEDIDDIDFDNDEINV